MSWLFERKGEMTPEQQIELPSEKNLEKLKGLEVKGEDGKAVSFKSLIEDASHPRVLTIFIRHFFCGFCEEYLKALYKDFSPPALSALNPPTKLIVIGCGDPSLIVDYKKRNNCPYEIYADPKRVTYDTLGFAVTLATGHKNIAYSDRSFASVVVSSFLTNLTAGPTKLFSGGKTAQNGGELIWVNGELKFIHRMATTTGHLGVPELKAKLEI
ncbi:hypothetical protein BDZ85DRAFT_318668 [Elsinoe ampelina]|uniref:AhpC/TSA antioxidant enzyme-domain-containing protein n=1 Tax=Elsinoe ampelina TaxID=302913 RepID=A0A6A6GCG0_9PEZI|nr:hypothetical protein BDZ85DRAFT_318668 [Elsinoe ampelina]